MQYEHTAAEELKEIAERQAVELAEKVGTICVPRLIITVRFKEELWEQEREMLKDELSSLRQRLTSTAGKTSILEAKQLNFRDGRNERGFPCRDRQSKC